MGQARTAKKAGDAESAGREKATHRSRVDRADVKICEHFPHDELSCAVAFKTALLTVTSLNRAASPAFGNSAMTTTKKILIVDDDDMLRDSLKEQFALHDEFTVVDAANATAGIKAAKADHADLVLLDVNLPDMDGREACKIMRRNGYKGPILMLTGQSSDSDTILGLDSGANDYITKPFRFGVLLARVRSHLRQHEQSEDAIFKVGPYTFKPSAKMLIRDDNRKIRLTEKETAIIKFLYRAGEQIVGRDVLLHDVWGYNAGVTTHTLETHIYRLRQKIERDPGHAEILVTEGGGYKLVP
jgi:DNA-binding response OmpR family regulator